MQQLANRHSLEILKLLEPYCDFLSSIRHIADMGCGTGADILWWATLEAPEDMPDPYDFNCFAVDRDPIKLDKIPKLKNLHKFNQRFDEERLFPVPIDFIWAHDSLQYSTNPLHTLKMWNSYMQENAMLVLSVPQHTGIEYNRQFSKSYSGCYYHYTPLMLIYMLAVNGFDVKDAYMLKRFQDPWINLAVYKSHVPPMDPNNTTWFDLADLGLLHPSIVTSLNANGFVKQEEIIMPWLDRELYFIDYVSQSVDFPPPTEDNGVQPVAAENTGTVSLTQASPVTKSTQLLKARPLMTKPPTRKSYRNV